MSWLPKWIRPDTEQRESDIQFGRQFEHFTAPGKADYWEKSLLLFEEENYLEAVEQLLHYLSYEITENVQWELHENSLDFSIRQGSKIIYGKATGEFIQVESPVAQITSPSIGLLRKLLELNFQLKYSRYSLDPGSRICLRFDSFAIDGSPFKLFAGMKEVALNADKEDDLILEDFTGLEPVNTSHILPIPDSEKQVKLKLFRKKLAACLTLVKDPDFNAAMHTTAIAYIILDTVYRLDYLTRPEGKTMAAFEEIQKSFFAGNAERTTEKIREAIIKLEQLSGRDDEDFLKELYKVPRTFSVLENATPGTITGLWDAELRHIDWYLENGQEEIARAIVGYLFGYCIFNYAMQPLFVDLIQMYYVIEESEFLEELGLKYRFMNQNRELNQSRFKSSLKAILEKNGMRDDYLDILDFRSDAYLARSYLVMLSDLMKNE